MNYLRVSYQIFSPFSPEVAKLLVQICRVWIVFRNHHHPCLPCAFLEALEMEAVRNRCPFLMIKSVYLSLQKAPNSFEQLRLWIEEDPYPRPFL